ncbi:M15 family metallopeptidase [Macrococcus equi]|uniref:M15 family metallopeptidase n=1 Tax=Macrococcus equi TaxID=3395462 RepID=UPI0039BDAED0
MKKSFIIICSMLLAACSHSGMDAKDIQEKQQDSKQIEQRNHKSKSHQQSKHTKVVKDGLTYIDGILIVNKDIALPKAYAPGENKEAREAVESLMHAGNNEGLNFVLRSGFRSYETQENLYNNYVARDGQEKADTYSARPGHSEHQTGLAFDLGNTSAKDDFKVSFESTPEGQWLKEHAHVYGFIIRYPKGKTDITGYQYEPWHLRYLGKDNAQKVKASGLTLEEYLGLK